MRSGFHTHTPPVSGPRCIPTNTYEAHFVPFNSFKGNSIKFKRPQEERREPRSPFGLQGHHILLHLATRYLQQQTFHSKSSPLPLWTQIHRGSVPCSSTDSFCGFGQVASPSQTPGSKENNLFYISEEGGG